MVTTVTCLRPAEDVIEFRHVGDVSDAELTTAFGQMVELARANDIWHLLSDATEMTDAPKFLEILPLVELLSSYGVKDRFRQALIRAHDPVAQSKVDFWAAAMTDHALRVLSFDDRGDALGWLASQE